MTGRVRCVDGVSRAPVLRIERMGGRAAGVVAGGAGIRFRWRMMGGIVAEGGALRFTITLDDWQSNPTESWHRHVYASDPTTDRERDAIAQAVGRQADELLKDRDGADDG